MSIETIYVVRSRHKVYAAYYDKEDAMSMLSLAKKKSKACPEHINMQKVPLYDLFCEKQLTGNTKNKQTDLSLTCLCGECGESGESGERENKK